MTPSFRFAAGARALLSAALVLLSPVVAATTVTVGLDGGPQTVMRDTDTQFAVSGDKFGLTLTAIGAEHDLVLKLAPARGREFERGIYYYAERTDERTGLSPGVDAVWDGAQCDEVWGAFTISQIGYAADGRVNLLEASFAQSCEPRATPLVGVVKYRSRPLFFTYDSTPGDWLGLGQEHTFLGYTSDFELTGNASTIAFSVEGDREYWSVDINAPTSGTLAPGTYQTASWGSGTSVAGLRVRAPGRGCSNYAGTLTIVDVRFNGAGAVTALHAYFSVTCDGGPPLEGTIRHLR